LAGLAPQQIGDRRISEAARHRLVEAVPRSVKALDGPFAGAERLVVGVDIGVTEIRGFGVGAREDERRNAHGVGGEPRGNELLDRFSGWDQDLTAHVAALFDRRQLILEVDAAAPASIIAFINSNALSTPPKPASASATIGAK